MRTRIKRLPGRKAERERGSVSAEVVLVIGLVMVVSFGAIQYALDAFAKQAARSAAADGLAAAEAQDGDARTATLRAGDMLAQLTGDLHSPTITVKRTATEASVTITGTASSLFGLTQRVTVTESGPVERFLGADS